MPIQLGVQSSVLCITSHNDYLFIASSSGIVKIFDINTLQQIQEFVVFKDSPEKFEMQVHHNYLFTLVNDTLSQWSYKDQNNAPLRSFQNVKCFVITDYAVLTFSQYECQKYCIVTGNLLSNKTWKKGEIASYVSKGVNALIEYDLSFIFSSHNNVYRFFTLTKSIVRLFDTHHLCPDDHPIVKFMLDNNTLFAIDNANHIFRFNLVSPNPYLQTFSKPYTSIFPYDDLLFVAVRTDIKMSSTTGRILHKIRSHKADVTALYAAQNKLFSGASNGDVAIDDLPIFQEDTTVFSEMSVSKTSLVKKSDVSDCTNDSLINLKKYTTQDDPIIIYLLNSQKEFTKAICVTETELVTFLRSDLDKNTPSNIMAIYTRPSKPDTTGIGSSPTGRIVIKLPINNIYVTYGSMIRIFEEMFMNKVWYAVPLYGGKRRRIGNVQGIFGISMNHGQIPGEIVYKLFSANDISDFNGVTALELKSDWPDFITNASAKLNDVVEMGTSFVNLLINELTLDMHNMMQL